MASVPHASAYNRRITDRYPGDRQPGTAFHRFLGADGIKVSWGGIWGGVLMAIGILILLSALGLAVGITATRPGETEVSTLGTGAGIWAAVSLLIALFVGGMAATSMGAISDSATGFCEGALVWVVSILLVGYAATSGIGMLAGGAFKLVGGAAQAVGTVVQAETGGGADLSGSTQQIVQKLRDPNTARQVAQATGMSPQDVQQALNDTASRVEQARDNPAQAASEARQGMSQLMERAKSSGALQQKAEEAKPAATKAAWIAFGALLLSLITAVIGAMVGRRSPVETVAAR
jgi:hypothetical protein